MYVFIMPFASIHLARYSTIYLRHCRVYGNYCQFYYLHTGFVIKLLPCEALEEGILFILFNTGYNATYVISR